MGFFGKLSGGICRAGKTEQGGRETGSQGERVEADVVLVSLPFLWLKHAILDLDCAGLPMDFVILDIRDSRRFSVSLHVCNSATLPAIVAVLALATLLSLSSTSASPVHLEKRWDAKFKEVIKKTQQQQQDMVNAAKAQKEKQEKDAKDIAENIKKTVDASNQNIKNAFDNIKNNWKFPWGHNKHNGGPGTPPVTPPGTDGGSDDVIKPPPTPEAAAQVAMANQLAEIKALLTAVADKLGVSAPIGGNTLPPVTEPPKPDGGKKNDDEDKKDKKNKKPAKPEKPGKKDKKKPPPKEEDEDGDGDGDDDDDDGDE